MTLARIPAALMAAGAFLVSAPASWGLSFTTSSYGTATAAKPYYELTLTGIELDGRFDSLYERRAFYYSARVGTSGSGLSLATTTQGATYRSEEYGNNSTGMAPRNVISLMGTAIVFDTLEPRVSEQTAIDPAVRNRLESAYSQAFYAQAGQAGTDANKDSVASPAPPDNADQALSAFGSLSPLQTTQAATRFDPQVASSTASSSSGPAVSADSDPMNPDSIPVTPSEFPTREDANASNVDTTGFDTPEPTAAAMALIGLAAICVGAWRRGSRRP